MKLNVYLKRGVAYIPTVGKIGNGIYLDIDPVRVVKVENFDDLQAAIKRAIADGNPKMTLPKGVPAPKPVVLSYANVRSWAIFAKDLRYWEIENIDDTFYIKLQRRSVKRGFEDDPAGCEALPQGTTIDEVAHRVADRINVVARSSSGSA